MPSVQISEKTHKLLNDKKKEINKKYPRVKIDLSTIADTTIQECIGNIEEKLGLRNDIGTNDIDVTTAKESVS